MKKTLLVLFAILFAVNLDTKAEDFSAEYDENIIYYRITSSSVPRTVAVTFKGYSYNYYKEYSGPVTVPSSVEYNGDSYKITSIDDDAFRDCDHLTSIIIPTSVTSIGKNAFRDCSVLDLIYMPNLLTSIGDFAFYDCRDLTSISIPYSVTSIGYKAFDCTPFYNNKPDGVVYINRVLYNYKGIMPANTNITIPDGKVSISNSAFSGCSGLTSITIPSSITSIGDYVFQSCSGLTSITIPSNLTTIGNSVFAGCSGLTSIIIPSSVNSIGNHAFAGCSGFTSIIIPNSVTSIGSNAFRDCAGLTSIVIPESITCINTFTFINCTNLSSVFLPNSIDSICNSAFYGCRGLMSITIPNSVTNIGENAFYLCNGLAYITSLSTTPPFLGANVFYFVNKSIPLYVPEASIPLYQAANQWQDFYNIQKIGLNDIQSANNFDILMYPNPTQDKTKLEIENLNSDAEVLVYDNNGRLIQNHKIKQGTKELNIDLRRYAKGVYNIRVVNETRNQTKKLIVQ